MHIFSGARLENRLIGRKHVGFGSPACPSIGEAGPRVVPPPGGLRPLPAVHVRRPASGAAFTARVVAHTQYIAPALLVVVVAREGEQCDLC